ncbi:hypothetical protein ACFSUD_05740 [Sulfitobacter aestuarii]|uniref:Uncharacterized protein n=1 Tax=Sulfitobacter aestuarii TaxID=2161676 RepID=A0ABW5U1N1_9RHOB
MFTQPQKLEVSQDELAVIEAALHTQSKILKVQASAGGKGALNRLNDVKRTLAHIAQQKPPSGRPRRFWSGLWGMRILSR